MQLRRSTFLWPRFVGLHTRLRTPASLSPDLAAGIRRVKGVRKHGVRVGNWLTIDQGHTLLQAFDRTHSAGSKITP